MSFKALATSVVALSPTILLSSAYTPQEHGTVVRVVDIRDYASKQAFEPVVASIPPYEHLVTLQGAVWLDEAIAHVEGYRNLVDGWRGEDSVAPSRSTVDDAAALISQIASEMPDVSMPLIGVDDDGILTLFWNEGTLLATISVYGDGTCSFYAQSSASKLDNTDMVSAKADSHEIGQPLPSDLFLVMVGEQLLEAA